VIPPVIKLGPVVGTAVNFIMAMACTVLSFYAMQIISVKILLESESHKIRDMKARKHQRDGIKIVILIAICLLGNSVAASLGSVRWDSFSFLIYRILTLMMLVRLAFELPFFLKRRPDLSLDLWVFVLVFFNLAIQFSTFLRPLVRFLSSYGFLPYSDDLDLAVFKCILIASVVTDLLTSLSILYLHHRMGLRQIAPKKKVNLYHDSQAELPEQMLSLKLKPKSKNQESVHTEI